MDVYLGEYRRAQQSAGATTTIQSAWRGRNSRQEVFFCSLTRAHSAPRAPSRPSRAYLPTRSVVHAYAHAHTDTGHSHGSTPILMVVHLLHTACAPRRARVPHACSSRSKFMFGCVVCVRLCVCVCMQISTALEQRREEYRVFLRAWRHITAAHKHARIACLERAYLGWLREAHEAKAAISRLAFLLQRSIGSSPAFAVRTHPIIGCAQPLVRIVHIADCFARSCFACDARVGVRCHAFVRWFPSC